MIAKPEAEIILILITIHYITDLLCNYILSILSFI